MTAYPIRVLSLGAGVQSTTLLLMMLEGEIPRADHVVFADTGWEPANVYQHLDYLRGLMDEAGMPFHMVSAGNIREDFLAIDRNGASIPLHLRGEDGKKGIARRQCTSRYKLEPLLKEQRRLAGLKPGQRCPEHRVTTVIGISYDEVQRMRDPKFSWIRHEYPLIDRRLTRQDCLKWCDDHGYPIPPRSACIGCPYKSQNEWRLLRSMPDEWDDAVAFDRALRDNPKLRRVFRGELYLHASLVPLSEVDLRTDDEKGILSLFDQDCEGMCGL